MSGTLLLATDLDRTLIPNGPQPESPGVRAHFAALTGRPEVTLCYVSGRHRELVQRAITEHGLPPPDFVVGDVGTSIYRVDAGGEWRELPGWNAAIAQDWAGHGHADLMALLEGLAPLRAQEPSRQNRFKLSYYLPPEIDPRPLEAGIRKRLQGTGIRTRLVWSTDELLGIGMLDILPAGASKYHALRALMAAQDFGEGETVFCGDSGNDLEVLASRLPAVLVANSLPAVRERAREMAAAAGHADRLYIARGGFMGLNGNYSAGILEGIAHYHPELIGWMGFADGTRHPHEREQT